MFDRPQRQHALGLLILIGWQAQALVRSTWPVFVAFYFQGDRDARFFIWAIAAGCALTFLGAVLHFARFTFHLEADQLHVRKGVLVRDKVNIPLDRVQAVHVEQNLLQRLFKVCGLKIDTAGSAGSELVIHALPWDDAHALRSRLLQSARDTEAESPEEPQASPNLVAALDTATLLKVGLSQNHLSKIGFAIGGLLTFQGVAWEVVAELWQQVPSLYRTVLLFLSPLLLVLSPVVIAAVSVLISVATSVVKHWKLRVWVEADEDPTKRALHLTQGLLNRQSMQVPLHKVQWVMWENTWIRRQFGFDTLHVRQASAGGAAPSVGGLKLTIPAVDGPPTRAFEGLVFPSWPERPLGHAASLGLRLLDEVAQTHGAVVPSCVGCRLAPWLADWRGGPGRVRSVDVVLGTCLAPRHVGHHRRTPSVGASRVVVPQARHGRLDQTSSRPIHPKPHPSPTWCRAPDVPHGLRRGGLALPPHLHGVADSGLGLRPGERPPWGMDVI